MANVTDKVAIIRNATYGNEVREGIASGIENINTEVISTTGKQEVLETVFNGLVINAGSDNAEIVVARGIENSLPIRLNKFDSSLAQKANEVDTINDLLLKRDKAVKINATYDFDDETKAQMTGNTPITYSPIPLEGSITPEKTTFFTFGKNLYNKANASIGYYINGSNGALHASALFNTSDFISVLPSTQYAFPSCHRIAYYNSSMGFISYTDAPTSPITTPANTLYVKYDYEVTTDNIQQFEKGAIATSYEEYYGDAIDIDKLRNDSIIGSKIKNRTILPTHFNDYSKGKNLFNEETVVAGKFINANTGLLSTNLDYNASDFIEILPNTEYVLKYPQYSAFYDISKVYISGFVLNSPSTFTTPSNAKYVRTSATMAQLNTQQLELGSVTTNYEKYGYKLLHLLNETPVINTTYEQPLYTFNDMWVEWLAGSKFPIGIMGDSTIDGVNTTGYVANTIGVASTSPNTLCNKLESLMRIATNNNILKVYNAGFAGTYALSGITNIDAEFGGTSPYNDVKMIGIGYGINDRYAYGTTEKVYRNTFKDYITQIIKWCYAKGIQPFLITTQAIVSPNVATDQSIYPLRYASPVETIANEVKIELALTYNLELIDVNKFTEMFLNYSSFSTNSIIPDRLHFTDIGHKYEAELLFSQMCPQTIISDSYTKIDYSNQRVTSGVPENWLTMPTTPTDNFKVYVNYNKTDTTDLKIMNIWLFVNTKKQLSLKAFRNNSALTYVKVNGIKTVLTTAETNLGLLEMGLHKLEVFTGVSTTVDFKGFIFE